MSFAILIFDWNPDSTQVFKLPNDQLSETDHKMLAAAHGLMANGDEMTEALEYVCNAVQARGDCDFTFEGSEEAAGKFLPFRVYEHGNGKVARKTMLASICE